LFLASAALALSVSFTLYSSLPIHSLLAVQIPAQPTTLSMVLVIITPPRQLNSQTEAVANLLGASYMNDNLNSKG
jgi:hypothetical protein